jgi:KUP system potassium uptake protein
VHVAPACTRSRAEFLYFSFVSDVAVIVSVVILIGLFSMQHYGTDKVSWLFAPIVFVWFILIGIVGAVNISRYDQSVLKAFNPVYVYRYFKRGKSSWASLGGIMLSITGLNLLPYFIV